MKTPSRSNPARVGVTLPRASAKIRIASMSREENADPTLILMVDADPVGGLRAFKEGDLSMC
jgi:hypothetical protein